MNVFINWSNNRSDPFPVNKSTLDALDVEGFAYASKVFKGVLDRYKSDGFRNRTKSFRGFI